MAEKTVEELKKELALAKKEISHLKEKYDSDIVDMQKEIKYLKEQLMAQQGMLNNAITYATKLESDFKGLKKEIDSGNFESIH
ncbi:hypothetical protein GCM10027429_20740 [Marivirga atlantica]|jgi:chromosome segregation ATPase|uniref:Uncharacterized protein n=1 Tax=Marivirga atlantica TaxID=1548457 RepID=A0A937AFC2_9BACT|nr:hypothetical protein [Marivirga atlantica]MBL0765691.1 hypothetical protein [Marivirga atlantica]